MRTERNKTNAQFQKGLAMFFSQVLVTNVIRHIPHYMMVSRGKRNSNIWHIVKALNVLCAEADYHTCNKFYPDLLPTMGYLTWQNRALDLQI
jgi:hypothetical protein